MAAPAPPPTKPPTDPYKLFRSWVALQRVSIDTLNEKTWKFYDFGPKDTAPLLFLPGASGTAETFYKQFISLSPKGFRIISVQYPDYMTHDAFCKGMDRFLDKLGIDKVHLFGTSLGGYLAQCFIQYRPQRVASLILCNAFSDTQYYKDNAPCVGLFPVMPEFMLKRMILANFPTKVMEAEIANSIDFMVQQLETLTQSELASRLTLNCTLYESLKPAELPFDKTKITLLDTVDEVAIPEKVREEVYKFYPEAKVAQLKTGGNFPYISRSDEVNMHIQVHLRALGVFPNKAMDMEGVEDSESTKNTEEVKQPDKDSKQEEVKTEEENVKAADQ